ncbi:fibronectin type III-like domain-contianing protein, partial [Bifidobacterium amazonense]
GDLSVDLNHDARTANVSLTVENTGKRDEREVVQVYVKNLDSPLAPRNWRLAGFQPVELTAGENKTLTLPVDPDAFKVYDENGEQIVDGNRFEIYAGISQPDARSAELLGFPPESMTIEF